LRKDLWRLTVALELLAGTKWWIPTRLCDSGIFLAETSEEAPPPSLVSRWLRNYRSQGILQRLFGHVACSLNEVHARNDPGAVFCSSSHLRIRSNRFPVVTNMDFGHTSPQMVIPMGCSAVIDPAARTAAIIPVTG
jgi:muramoyltetrapeptide carboxypeptidase LdcA involved in peptidoglycan recycling